MPQQEPITLFPGVEIMSNHTIQHTKEYLKRHCTVDTLGDTLYVKKIGNDFTTYAIEFDSDWVYKVRKINDENGVNFQYEPIFKRHDDDDLDDDINI